MNKRALMERVKMKKRVLTANSNHNPLNREAVHTCNIVKTSISSIFPTQN